MPRGPKGEKRPADAVGAADRESGGGVVRHYGTSSPRASSASASPIGGLVRGKRAFKRLTTAQVVLRLLSRGTKP